MPPSIEPALEPYVRQKWHFLALQLRAEASTERIVAPHPISYKYEAKSLVYPLIISGPSAAVQNEIVLYVLGRSRFTTSNWTNFSLDEFAVSSAFSESGTNYESQVRRISDGEGYTFITEFAGSLDNSMERALLEDLRGRTGATEAHYLTRLRAVVRPSKMDRDVVLEPQNSARDVDRMRNVAAGQQASLASPVLLLLLPMTCFAVGCRKSRKLVGAAALAMVPLL